MSLELASEVASEPQGFADLCTTVILRQRIIDVDIIYDTKIKSTTKLKIISSNTTLLILLRF